MLSARDLTLRRGADPLFEKVNFTIFRGERVGLTGANGAGKSSLFAALSGELAPDSGDIELPASLKIAHVEQEVSALDRPAIEFVLDGDAELRRVMSAIEDAERRARLPSCTALVSRPPSTSARSRSSPAAGGCGSAWLGR